MEWFSHAILACNSFWIFRYEMRARNIKPGFFRNEELAEISIAARLLFIGLWCMADREGLLEDRPKKIKLEIMPYDDVDIGIPIKELADHRLILRYNINGSKYISIPKFKKHQHPHHNERPSSIPFPNKANKVNKIKKTCDHGSKRLLPLLSERGKRKEERGTLNPDILNPDILNPDLKDSTFFNKKVQPTGKKPAGRKPEFKCPQNEIKDLYHSILPELPKVRVWNNDRQAWLRARWKQNKDYQNLEWWKRFFTWVRESDWLMGRTKEEFRCDLEWLVRKTNFAKIANGRYHRTKKGTQPGIDEWLKLSKEKVKKEKNGAKGKRSK